MYACLKIHKERREKIGSNKYVYLKRGLLRISPDKRLQTIDTSRMKTHTHIHTVWREREDIHIKINDNKTAANQN